MEFEIVIDTGLAEPKAVIYTAKITDEIKQLVSKLKQTGSALSSLIGYKGDEVLLVEYGEISSLYCEGQYVYARTDNGSVRLKQRLYELEELLPDPFVRISNSEIVNFKKVKKLDLSISGTISLKFITGECTFVSRRYVDKIKKYLGL